MVRKAKNVNEDLLIKKGKIPRFDIAFGQNVKSDLESVERDLYEVKVIEIYDENKVLTIKEFFWYLTEENHPQQIFISDSENPEDDGKYLLERNGEVF